jgi:RNA polymerase sigma factor (TIGR02999 family)
LGAHSTPMPRQESLTDALGRLRAGEEGALDRLVPLIYDDLRRLARRQLARRGPRRTLDTTALVHEAYLKFAGLQGLEWKDRGHFFAVAARVMRHVLIDYARGRRCQKRGGGQPHLTLDESRIAVEQEAEQILALDEALSRLAGQEERLARVVECRFFAGLSEAETAAALDVSERTVQRDWERARAWLKKELAH